MRAVHFILGIPLFVFLVLAFSLDFGTLVTTYPQVDLTAYLAARSVALDHDLAFTKTDSDRYFRERLTRPGNFAVTKKKVLLSSGEYRETHIFHDPEIYVLLLAPFAGFLGFHGVLLFHALLIGALYATGYLHYAKKGVDSAEPALNAFVYYTLIPVPVLFLIPSHALLLFVVITAAIYCAIHGRAALSAAFLGAAFSLQPWSILFAALLPAFWKQPETAVKVGRFAVSLAIAVFLAWGLSHLMAPAQSTSEVRWVAAPLGKPLSEVWDSLPRVDRFLFAAPHPQRVLDFLFGRNNGFLVYAFPAAALLMAGLWRMREPWIRHVLLFAALFLAVTSFVHPSCWNINLPASDLWILLAPLPFFLMPIVQPRLLFVTTVVLSSILSGPLLVNPFGALANREYYLQSFPYRYFPVELSTIGRAGLTANPEFRIPFAGGALYLLNDAFYPEQDFLWTRGESSLEFLVVLIPGRSYPALRLQNGTEENYLSLRLGEGKEGFHLGAGEEAVIDLGRFATTFREFDGRFYLHGKIDTSGGYVPKLLSRDNSDYRFLGCRIHIVNQSKK
jgi:hypothetical protein